MTTTRGVLQMTTYTDAATKAVEHWKSFSERETDPSAKAFFDLMVEVTPAYVRWLKRYHPVLTMDQMYSAGIAFAAHMANDIIHNACPEGVIIDVGAVARQFSVIFSSKLNGANKIEIDEGVEGRA
jgi:hypothetical protein